MSRAPEPKFWNSLNKISSKFSFSKKPFTVCFPKAKTIPWPLFMRIHEWLFSKWKIWREKCWFANCDLLFVKIRKSSFKIKYIYKIFLKKLKLEFFYIMKYILNNLTLTCGCKYYFCWQSIKIFIYFLKI